MFGIARLELVQRTDMEMSQKIIDCSDVFYSRQNRIRRLLPPIWFVVAFILLISVHGILSWVLIFILAIPSLIISSKAGVCPNCKRTIRRLMSKYTSSEKPDPYGDFMLRGLLQKDGTCWNCGAILNRKKWERYQILPESFRLKNEDAQKPNKTANKIRVIYLWASVGASLCTIFVLLFLFKDVGLPIWLRVWAILCILSGMAVAIWLIKKLGTGK